MDIIYLFDYDETLLFKDDSKNIPVKEITEMIKLYNETYKLPFVVITAGSVNYDCESIERLSKGHNHITKYIRPYELFKGKCGLEVEINNFSVGANVCVFGKYVARNGSRLTPQNKNIMYIDQGHELYIPAFLIGDNYYKLLDENHSKKISVIYHLLRKSGINPFIALIDDANHHDFSGLEDMVLDPFETVGSMYYMVEPLQSDKKSINRILDITNALKQGIMHIFLSNISINVWKRFETNY